MIVISAVVRIGEDAYGVPISREIEQQTRRSVALASVYAALGRLEAKGFVTAKLGEATPERGGRAKKYFRITGEGRRAVREARQNLLRLWSGVPGLGGVSA